MNLVGNLEGSDFYLKFCCQREEMLMDSAFNTVRALSGKHSRQIIPNEQCNFTVKSLPEI